MKPFADLTPRGQVSRLRPVARAVLEAYGFEDAAFRKVRHWQNTTFRVDVPALARPWKQSDQFIPGRYLLRISRPYERTAAQIEGELAWLGALSAEGRLTVPKPLRTVSGDSSVVISNTNHQGLDGGEERDPCWGDVALDAGAHGKTRWPQTESHPPGWPIDGKAPRSCLPLARGPQARSVGMELRCHHGTRCEDRYRSRCLGRIAPG